VKKCVRPSDLSGPANTVSAHCFVPSLCIAALCAFSALSLRAQNANLTSQYQWNPVQIGAGGWMRGMAVSPSDPTRRYARGDVDEVYRWDNSAQQWFPTKVSGALPAAYSAAPINGGGGAIAIDPKNPNHVLAVFTLNGSADIGNSSGLNVFYSTDGAKTWTAGNLNLSGNLSSETTGERIVIDPNNSNLAYLGPPGAGAGNGNPDGLQRSLDGGITWAQVTGGGLPVSTTSIRYEFQLPRIDGGTATASVAGQTASKIVYVTYITHNEANKDAVTGGGVLKSADGGNTWTDITGKILSSGSSTVGFATLDNFGNLWIADASNNNLYQYTRTGYTWTTTTPPHGGDSGIAVDPANAQRIFAAGGSSIARSLNGGSSWTDLGPLQYSSAQPIEWLRPSSFRPQGHYDSVSALYMDPAGVLWIACGNDGILTTTPNDATDSLTNPPIWTSASEGIEEAVSEPSVVPPGGDPVLTVEDETLFTITDPSTYTAQHFPIDLWANNDGLSSSTDSNYAPNQPKYVVEVSANLSEGNPSLLSSQFSGYSADGGETWQVFPSIAAGTHPCILYFGSIAVSARPAGQENNPPGTDNLVWIPSNYNDFSIFAQGPAPFYSKDGGATWTQTTSFNAAPGALQRTECPSNTSYTYMGFQWGPWIFALSQHLLVADPVTPGTFYADLTAGGFWKSTDGGVTWAQEPATNAPNDPHHGTLATVPGVSGDMWLIDGNGGASSHGLFHTLDGGNTFTRSPVFDYAWTLALGKSAPGKSYPAIYVYGLYHGDANWGVFQSIDGGVTFNRISYYPYGILDIPNTMTASWDVFGTVYIGFSGNTFYYGVYNNAGAAPGAPTLAATAANTTVSLSWSPGAGGTPTSFDLYRGTASGKESSTPIATFDGSTSSYQDTGLTAGATYYYFLTATNTNSASPNSNEVSATIAPAGISLGAAASGSLSATVTAGGTAVFNLALSSVNYVGAITFSCAGVPATNTCTSAPSTATITAVTTSTPVTIAVQTSLTTAALAGEHRQLLGVMFWPISLLAAPLFLRRRRLRGRFVVGLATAFIMGITACSSTSNSSQPASSTYTLTVTATGTGGVSPATATLTLTVQP